MDEATELRSLLDRFQRGDPAAADDLCRRFGRFIQLTVRRQMSPDLRTLFDSLDFVQDVWVSVLAVPHDRYQFATPAAFLGFLARVAQNKVAEEARRLPDPPGAAGGRDGSAPDRGQVVEGLPSPDPSPSQMAVAGELWEQLLDHVPARHRVIIERLRDGHTYDDIARMAGVSPRTIKRIVRRLKELGSPARGSTARTGAGR